MKEQFLCACGTNLKCKGICRETNLFRKRSNLTRMSRCPAAYKVSKLQRRIKK